MREAISLPSPQLLREPINPLEHTRIEKNDQSLVPEPWVCELNLTCPTSPAPCARACRFAGIPASLPAGASGEFAPTLRIPPGSLIPGAAYTFVASAGVPGASQVCGSHSLSTRPDWRITSPDILFISSVVVPERITDAYPNALQAGRSQVLVRVNAPPTGGSVAVSNSDPIGAQQQIKIFTDPSQWQDLEGDTPIHFLFGYQVRGLHLNPKFSFSRVVDGLEFTG